MSVLLIPLIALVGILNAVQTGPNTELARRSGQPIAGALLVELVGLATLLAITPLFGLRMGSLREATHAPWWAWSGGVLGVTYVLTMVYATPRVGAGVFTGVTVTAGIAASVVLDHFGWLGLPEHPASALRAVGCLLMIAGVVLVARY